jgi:DNA repair exonuclease SbcCD nuclease subunit
LLHLAGQEQTDFIVLAGDTFEDNAVSRHLVRDIITLLSKAPCPVYILPGNHDPLNAGSVWEMPEWRTSAQITILDEEKPVEVMPGVTLFPCPVRERYGVNDPTVWIPPAAGDGIRIGIAHGSVEGLRMDDPQFPIPRDAAARRSLDYLALGHWHSYAEYPADDRAIRMAYSGTHEPTAFGERDSGNALLVEISGHGSAPVLQKIRSAALQWHLLDEYVSQDGDLAKLRSRIVNIADPASALVRLRLRGLFPPGDIGHLADLLSFTSGNEFLFFELLDEALHPSPAGDDWLDEIPDAAVREAAKIIADDSGESGNAQLRRQALLELYAIMREVS